MAKRKKTPTFICQLPLKVSPKDQATINSRLYAAKEVYNASLNQALRRLRKLQNSKQYLSLQTQRKHIQQAKISLQDKKILLKELNSQYHNTYKEFGFTEYDLHKFVTQFNQSSCWISKLLGIHEMQKLASRAFDATQKYLFRIRGRPRYKKRLRSVEGKSNGTGIRWRSDCIKWNKLALPAIIDQDNEVVQHGLNSKIKYCRIVKKDLRGKSRFYVQLVCEGKALIKEKNQLGSGIVGIDIGPSTIAAVGQDSAILEEFCSDLKKKPAEKRRIQRKLDRQRRVNNPGNYNSNGTIKRGRKAWKTSGQYRKTLSRLRELERKLKAHRKSQHGEMINKLLRMGNCFKTEKVSIKAWQKLYGRSIRDKAPGMFLQELKRKAESAGGQFLKFSTRRTWLSQRCICGARQKKSLSQRRHVCDCGIACQRDLYSAWLSCYVDDMNNFDESQSLEDWPGADKLLRSLIEEKYELASCGKKLPASFGLCRRQSGSAVKECGNVSDTGTVIVGARELAGPNSGIPVL